MKIIVATDDTSVFLRKCIDYGFEVSIPVEEIKLILANYLGKKNVLFPFGKNYLKSFIKNLEFMKMGSFNETTGVFTFDQNNEIYTQIMIDKVKSEKK